MEKNSRIQKSMLVLFGLFILSFICAVVNLYPNVAAYDLGAQTGFMFEKL